MTTGQPQEQPRRRLALVHGRVILPDAVATDRAVIVEGGQLAGVVATGALGADIMRLDVGGRIITPGLIDLHIHGAVGHSFNEPTDEAFTDITRENARRGVTALLATLATAPLADVVRCLEFCRTWMRQPHAGARVLGAHIEGPFISPDQKGALDPHHLHTPAAAGDVADRLLAYHDIIKIMVLAPELPGAGEFIARLVKLGIVPAAGHSAAKDTEVLAAMTAGLRHVTHVWSAMSTTVREGPWRKPGLLEAALTFDKLTVEMIADNKHLPPTLMRLAYKCIGADRLCVISDATSGAGLPEGAHFRMGGMEYDVHDGVGMLLDRTAFAGSATLLNQMIPVLTHVVGIPLPEVIRMLTLTPARVLGIQDRTGSLESGKDADLAIFNTDFSVWRTMLGGQWIYTA